MKNITLFTVIVFLSACNACKKPASIPYYPINDSLKAAFNFMPGTYWIYKDSISGEVDSFYVEFNGGVQTGTENTGTYNFTFESLNLNIYEVSTSTSSSNILVWQYGLSDDEVDLTYYGQNIHATSYQPFFNYPFQYSITAPPWTSVLITSDSMVVDSIYDSYTINSIVFTNVEKVNHWYDNNAGTGLLYNDVFYVCPGAGMIKMKLYHPLDSINRVWELQRWNIVK